ncbi:MAG: MFS transporter [Acidimicrobiia bacterium]|nr:MFS transporter [Acidimicrobiia bacterium]
MTEHHTNDQRALRAVAVQFWVNGMVVASYVPRLPGIRDKLELDLRTIGTLIAFATAAGLVGSVGVGPAVDRFGTKRVMIGGASVLVLALPFVGIVSSAAALLVVLGLIAAADVFTDVAMNIQGSVLSARRHAPVMNRLHAMWSLGTVVGGVVAAAMAAWDVDLRVHLAGASVFLLCTLLYVAPGLLTNEERPAEDVRAPSSSTTGVSTVIVTFALLGAAAILPEVITSDWAAFRLTDDLGATEGLAGLAYVSFTSGMVAGRLAGDMAVHRLGGALVLQGATLLATIGIMLATLVPAAPVVFVGLFLAGIGVSVMFPQLYDAAAQAPRPGKALGGLTAGTRIALLVAPFLVGVLADTDALTVGAAIAIATIPAAVVLLVLTRRLHGH